MRRDCAASRSCSTRAGLSCRSRPGGRPCCAAARGSGCRAACAGSAERSPRADSGSLFLDRRRTAGGGRAIHHHAVHGDLRVPPLGRRSGSGHPGGLRSRETITPEKASTNGHRERMNSRKCRMRLLLSRWISRCSKSFCFRLRSTDCSAFSTAAFSPGRSRTPQRAARNA